MTQIPLFGKHAGREASIGYSDRWVEQFHGRDEAEQKYEPYEFDCTHVVHFTENFDAHAIGMNPEYPDKFCFKFSKWFPEKWKQDSIDSLCWWAAVPPENWEKTVKNAIPDLLDEYKSCLGNSPAFNGESLCGPIGFVCSWKDILNEYEKFRKVQKDEIEFRTLGTFPYNAEIMYGILVCKKGEEVSLVKNSQFTGTTKIEINVAAEETEAFSHSCNNSFKWKVYSTIGWCDGIRNPEGTGIKRTWDDLSFAFYFPPINYTADQESICCSAASDLNTVTSPSCDLFTISPRFCKIKTKFASEYRPQSRSNYPPRTALEKSADGEIVHRLKTKISNDKLFFKEEAAFDDSPDIPDNQTFAHVDDINMS